MIRSPLAHVLHVEDSQEPVFFYLGPHFDLLSIPAYMSAWFRSSKWTTRQCQSYLARNLTDSPYKRLTVVRTESQKVFESVVHICMSYEFGRIGVIDHCCASRKYMFQVKKMSTS